MCYSRGRIWLLREAEELGNIARRACNLIQELAHLFAVRSCWLQGRQHCQLEELAVGGALAG